MSAVVRPMLCKKGSPPRGAGWAFEWKWDGFRTIATVHAGAVVTLTSRNGQDVTEVFGELAELGRLVGGALVGDRRVILDGEVVALDGNGVPDIALVQDRMFGRGDAPVTIMVFDVLEFDGHRLTDATYDERRAVLTALDLNGASVRTPANFVDCDGAALLEVARKSGMEGLVAKRRRSRVIPGPRRTGEWVKTAVRSRREVVIGGWCTGDRGRLAALMMGAHNAAGDLVYLGKVGTGFTESALSILADRLGPLETSTCPFQAGRVDPVDAHWVTPRLVGDVEYRTATRDGILRYASWKGIRIDKTPQDVSVGDS